MPLVIVPRRLHDRRRTLRTNAPPPRQIHPAEPLLHRQARPEWRAYGQRSEYKQPALIAAILEAFADQLRLCYPQRV